MFIVENPQTKKLYLASVTTGKCQCIAFDGTPVLLDVTGWVVISQAPHATAWVAEPGNYRTYYGAISVLMIAPDGQKYSFKKADNISYLLNWIDDAKANGNTVSYQWIGAFSDRNAARRVTEV